MDKHKSMNKPVLSYIKQFQKLKNDYYLKTNLSDVIGANYLKKYSYYDLIDKYSDMTFFKDENNNKIKFFDYINFEYLLLFNSFDKLFQNIIFEYCLIVENLFKESLAHFIALNHGESNSNYLDPNKYVKTDSNNKSNELINLIANFKKNLKCKDSPTKDYMENYGSVPPWILFKNSTFDECLILFNYCYDSIQRNIVDAILLTTINSPNDKIKNEHISSKIKFIKNALGIIKFYRNKIAHNLNFANSTCCNALNINCNFLKHIFIEDIYKNYIQPDKPKNIFALIISIYTLLDDTELQITFIAKLAQLFPINMNEQENINIINNYINITGLPKNINIILDDILSFLYKKQNIVNRYIKLYSDLNNSTLSEDINDIIRIAKTDPYVVEDILKKEINRYKNLKEHDI